jgi:prolyl-tRNA synthetase
MRLSRHFLPILRGKPQAAETVSHRLSGLIRRQSARIYSRLPLGEKVLARIGQIVPEEQGCSGAIEIRMPTIQPCGLRRERGRCEFYG